MSQVYKKSIQNANSKFFEQQDIFEMGFNRYSILEKKIYSMKKKNNKFEDFGFGGIPLSWNKTEDNVYIDQTDSHTLIIGSTGSKKTRLISLPSINLLGSAGESMIISDPKAEIYNRTADYLIKKGYSISVVNLRAPEYGASWNPLDIPYQLYCKGDTDRAYEFVNDIAENLIHLGASTKEPFWDNSAGSLFFGLTIMLFKYCREFNMPVSSVHIGNVLRLRNIMLSGNDSEIKNSTLWRYAKKDNFLSSSLIGTIETAPNTRAGILSTFDQKMRCFAIQPNLIEMLATNSISLENIGQKPTAIYLIMPDEKTSYHKLISLFIKQSYEYMIYQAHKSESEDGIGNGVIPIRVNYILDEFSALPKIKDFPTMITAARSRNIRFCLIVQSKHQLLQRYAEETETIQSNCNNWIFITSRELKLLEEISKLCGNNSDQRPILSVSELQRLDKDDGEVLILSGRLKPFITSLPDIDHYDKKRYKICKLHKRFQEKIEYLDFIIPQETNKENEKQKIKENEKQKIKENEINRIKLFIEQKRKEQITKLNNNQNNSGGKVDDDI